MNIRLSNRRTTTTIARLLAVAALGLGGLVVAGTAGAQDAAECGTYGPACPTGSGSGSGSGGDTAGDASGTGGPDSGVSPDSVTDAGLPPSSANEPPSNGNPPSNADSVPISGPTGGATGPSGAPATVVQVTSPAPTVVAVTPGAQATPIVAGTAQAPVAGELGRTGTSAGTIAIVAAAVVLVGSALVLGARRRKQV